MIASCKTSTQYQASRYVLLPHTGTYRDLQDTTYGTLYTPPKNPPLRENGLPLTIDNSQKLAEHRRHRRHRRHLRLRHTYQRSST